MPRSHLRFPVVLSILAALATLAMKGTASVLTGSMGLLSDAAESLVNLLTALTAYVSLWYSSRPVDETHTYGHEKIEYFASGLIGMLIGVAAAGIVWYAVNRLIHPQPLHELGVGTAIAMAASLLNFVVARILLNVGRQHHSIVLEADGKHLMTDVWTSVGVIGGLFLVWLTGWDPLDPILAMLVAANILWIAGGLLLRSFNGLMDHALPAAEQTAVRQAIEANIQPGMHFHALRTRQAGARRFVDFHLLVPGEWTVQAAHDLTEQIEAAVRAALPGEAEVVVHIEPIESREAWHDSDLLHIEPPRAP